MQFEFTFKNLQSHLQNLVEAGYQVIRCIDYFEQKEVLAKSKNKICVLRVDIDQSPKKAIRLCEIFDQLKIKASFFVRLHANEYNAFGFETYRVLKRIRDSGHEIGYHSEIIDQAAIWQEDPAHCLKRDLKVLSEIIQRPIDSVASHGGQTGLNNLDFWKTNKPADFGLKYEAYSGQWGFDLFEKAFYISDSNWTYWKCYKEGKLLEGEKRSISEHLQDKHPLMYVLIHPETYFDNHFYE